MSGYTLLDWVRSTVAESITQAAALLRIPGLLQETKSDIGNGLFNGWVFALVWTSLEVVAPEPLDDLFSYHHVLNCMVFF